MKEYFLYISPKREISRRVTGMSSRINRILIRADLWEECQAFHGGDSKTQKPKSESVQACLKKNNIHLAGS